MLSRSEASLVMNERCFAAAQHDNIKSALAEKEVDDLRAFWVVPAAHVVGAAKHSEAMQMACVTVAEGFSPAGTNARRAEALG